MSLSFGAFHSIASSEEAPTPWPSGASMTRRRTVDGALPRGASDADLDPTTACSPVLVKRMNEWPFGTAVARSDSPISGGAFRHIDGTILGISPLGSTRCSRGSWHANIVGLGVNTNWSLFRFFAENPSCRRTGSSGPNDPNVGHSRVTHSAREAKPILIF
jgi:hypothetical protein